MVRRSMAALERRLEQVLRKRRAAKPAAEPKPAELDPPEPKPVEPKPRPHPRDCTCGVCRPFGVNPFRVPCARCRDRGFAHDLEGCNERYLCGAEPLPVPNIVGTPAGPVVLFPPGVAAALASAAAG